jgi:hypothetical protein
MRCRSGTKCPIIACNHCGQRRMDGMSPRGRAYCTQQTGGLTRGMALRAIQAAEGSRAACSRRIVPRHSDHEIACNTLACDFARLGLPPQSVRASVLPSAVPGGRATPGRGTQHSPATCKVAGRLSPLAFSRGGGADLQADARLALRNSDCGEKAVRHFVIAVAWSGGGSRPAPLPTPRPRSHPSWPGHVPGLDPGITRPSGLRISSRGIQCHRQMQNAWRRLRRARDNLGHARNDSAAPRPVSTG